jgi:hypothetical protein
MACFLALLLKNAMYVIPADLSRASDCLPQWRKWGEHRVAFSRATESVD